MEQKVFAKKWLLAKAKDRIPERDFGITGDLEPPAYDEMLRFVRDGGWMPTKHILKDIQHGSVLEVGPGPGYLGLEWLKATSGTCLVGYDISEDMLAIAGRNATEYSLASRVRYTRGDVRKMPFADSTFDAVFSNDSLHEWAYPEAALSEIWRVLKPGGRLHVSDLRRDMGIPLKVLIWVLCKPKSMRSGWITSIDASYTQREMRRMIGSSHIEDGVVDQDAMRFYVRARKRT